MAACSIRPFITIFLIAVTPLIVCEAWLLAQMGLNETYRVKHLSMHFSRVFLSIEVKSHLFPTLVEAQWPETYLPMRAQVYPQPGMHANGDHSDCTRIQQTRWSKVDSLSRLWVLDIGWQRDDHRCPPKLLLFDLIRNNAEVLRIDCGQHLEPNDKKLLAVKMGPKPSPCQMEKFLYFLMADDTHILAYDILQQSWHKRTLVSRKYASVPDMFPIAAIDIAFGAQPQNELLVSDGNGQLYATSNTLLLPEAHSDSNHTLAGAPADVLKLEPLGSLLGASKGMMVDYMGALFYTVPKFGAIVRCAYKRNLTTEDNEIIYLTSKNIMQIFFGFEGSVWLLSDRWLNPQDHCFPGF